MRAIPKFSIQDLSAATPGSFVRSETDFGIVTTNPNDPSRRRSLAALRGNQIVHTYVEHSLEVLSFGSDYTMHVDVASAIKMNAIPDVSAGTSLFVKDSKFYFVVVIPGSREYRLLDVQEGVLLVDRGERMVAIENWTLSVLSGEHRLDLATAKPAS